MVPVVTSGANVYGALAYNHKKVEAGNAFVLWTQGIPENPDGRVSLADCTEAFGHYTALNSRVRQPVVHISLNPSPEDLLTERQLTEIARDFMERFGYGEQPYIIYRHRDIARSHLHIVTIRVDSVGNAIDFYKSGIRAREICRQLERDYGLHPAIQGQEHRSRTDELSVIRPIDYKASDLKAQVKTTARNLLECYRFQSLSEFDTLAERFNLVVYESCGTVNGKEYHGIMYGARDDSGKQVGVPFKSSRLGKPFGWEAPQRKFTRDRAEMKEQALLTLTRNAVIRAMQNIGTKEDFAARLWEQHIDVVFRTNKSGRIYGITFIDHNTRTVANGSRLGKDLSASVFHELFNNPHANRERLIPKLPTEEAPPVLHVPSIPSREEYKPTYDHGQTADGRHQNPQLPSSTYSWLTGFDPLAALLPDSNEHQRFDPELLYGRKKKKRKQGRGV